MEVRAVHSWRKGDATPTCYTTCSYVPSGLVRAAGYRLVRLQTAAAALREGDPVGVEAAAGTCPYATRVTWAADTLLRQDGTSVLAVPWGCDGLRRCVDLLAATWPDRVRGFPVPRDDCAGSVRMLAGELGALQSWLRAHRDAANVRADGAGDESLLREADGCEDVFFELASAPQPGGLFVIGGPLSDGDLFRFLFESGAAVAGVESCLGPQRREQLAPLADPSLRVEEQARRLLSTVACPHRSRAQRHRMLEKRLRDTRAGAVLYLRQTFCDPGSYDSLLAGQLARESDLPFLELDAEFPFRLDGPVRTRLEAFLEAHALGEAAPAVPRLGEDGHSSCAGRGDDVFLEADLFLDPSEA